MFVRKLHDNQRRRIIEPLRHRFHEKLKMKNYICKNCGDSFKPVANSSCFTHRFDAAKASPKFEKNVSFKKCRRDKFLLKYRGRRI